jgi:hypothetical protein
MNSSSSGSSYQTAADTCSSSSSSYQTATSTAEGDFPPVRSHQCEQRDLFDFAYRPNLDGNLLAEHARQNFNKDKVFCDFGAYFF